MFLVIEGNDAAGKATQSGLLAKRLMRCGYEVGQFSFPQYSTPVGAAILRHLKGLIYLTDERPGVELLHALGHAPEDSMAFQGLMLLDKCEAAPLIRDHLAVGNFVVSDRWWLSALAYGVADGLKADWLRRIHSILPQGDLNIFLDLEPEIALQRRPKLRDRYELDREKQVLVRKNYHEIWDAGDDPLKWVKVDASPPEDVVHESIWQAALAAGMQKFMKNG